MFSIIVQLICTDIIRLTNRLGWSEKAYTRIPVFSPDKHQTDALQSKKRTGFFISSRKPLIHGSLNQSGKLYKGLNNCKLFNR